MIKTLPQLAAALNTLGYPVAYSHFKSKQQPPFICYLVTSGGTFNADNKPLAETMSVDIELYSATKNLAAEQKIKDMLAANELSWSFSETYEDGDGIFIAYFSIQLITTNN